MKRAIADLTDFSDDRLFKEVAEGVARITENATSLDESAARLHQGADFRASKIMQGFAEEEAAKVLILIDFIRCPAIPERRTHTLKHYYGHVAKRIYAIACTYPRIATFGELCNLVKQESRPVYLDGPKWVDWIFPNSISWERQQALYVDYVRDITEDSGECWWTTPYVPESGELEYETSDCIKLSWALSKADASSPDGLAEIARIWREYEPEPETDRGDLRSLVTYTLMQLAERGLGTGDAAISRYIVSSWPFPLWSVTIKEPRLNDDLAKLRREREHTIRWIEETEAKREPPPAISRSKVEKLAYVYASWEHERNEWVARTKVDGDNRLRIHSSEEMDKWFELPSYAQLEELYRDLNDEERTALLALGWFARETVADWPKIYETAKQRVSTLGENYQIGLAHYWLAGLERWEEEPRRFRAGELRRA